MSLKLYAHTTQHFFLYCTQICADAAGIEVEVVVPTDEMKEDKDFKAKKAHLSYPILELEDGTWIGEHIAICKYLLTKGGKAPMLGSNAFETAKVEQWCSMVATTWNKSWIDLLYSVFGANEDATKWTNMIKAFSTELPLIEANIKGDFLVGNDLTVADILVWRIAFALFSFVLGPDQRAALPKFTAWYEKMSMHPLIVATAGKYHMTNEPWKLFGSDAVITCGAAKKEEVKAAAEEDDCDDLFADSDEEDEDSIIARMELKAKAAQAKKGNPVKKVAIAKSMILFEVKPLDSETDLDVLANRILTTIEMDGLQWKQ